MEPKSYSAPKGRFVIIITFLLVVVAFVMLYFGVNTYFASGAYVQFFSRWHFVYCTCRQLFDEFNRL